MFSTPETSVHVQDKNREISPLDMCSYYINILLILISTINIFTAHFSSSQALPIREFHVSM